MKSLESLNKIEALINQYGALLVPSMVARLIGRSRQYVFQEIEAGRMESVLVDGQKLATLTGVKKWYQSVKPYRPLGGSVPQIVHIDQDEVKRRFSRRCY